MTTFRRNHQKWMDSQRNQKLQSMFKQRNHVSLQNGSSPSGNVASVTVISVCNHIMAIFFFFLNVNIGNRVLCDTVGSGGLG